MAAAEALYATQEAAPFSLLTIGTLDGSKAVFQIGLPSMLSFMSTGNFNGVVEGVNDLEAKYDKQFGAGDYTPNIPMAYWSFRLMIGFGFIGAFFALLALWQMRKGGSPRGKWFGPAMISLPFLPLLANSFGWIFTETARQPWAVFGLIKTADQHCRLSWGSSLYDDCIHCSLWCSCLHRSRIDSARYQNGTCRRV